MQISKNKLITKNVLLMELMNKHPEVIPILLGYGLHCVTCHFSKFDTIEAGAKLHGMDKETIDMMINDVNEIIKLKEEIE